MIKVAIPMTRRLSRARRTSQQQNQMAEPVQQTDETEADANPALQGPLLAWLRALPIRLLLLAALVFAGFSLAVDRSLVPGWLHAAASDLPAQLSRLASP